MNNMNEVTVEQIIQEFCPYLLVYNYDDSVYHNEDFGSTRLIIVIYNIKENRRIPININYKNIIYDTEYDKCKDGSFLSLVGSAYLGDNELMRSCDIILSEYIVRKSKLYKELMDE